MFYSKDVAMKEAYPPVINSKSFVENDYASLWIRNNIVFVECKAGAELTLISAREVVADRLELQQGKAFPVCCSLPGILFSNKAARDYLAITGSVLTTAVSFLVSPSVPLILLQFYLEKNKPLVPTQYSSSKVQALKFLEAYL